ncbi:MAG TPA: marine proteobacterial sortase target protein, partial [Rhodospirillaceae bacterium]|nr:marine proteobacterial sortase target protein [Rhodospirillaceae bacterium]
MPIVTVIGRRWWAFPLALAVTLVLMTAMATSSARADGPTARPAVVPAAAMDLGGLFLPAGDGGGHDEDGAARVRVVPLLGTDIKVQVSGLIARYAVTHRFRNPTARWTEAIYTYPLPPDSAVDRLRMTVGGRVTEGVIKERAEARRLYTAAKSMGRRASLVEQQRPNIFTTAVANLGPGEEVTVAIEFQERLAFRDGQFTLRLPLVVGPRYIPGQAHPVNFAGGAGWARDTDVVPDASKITPPLREADAGKGNPVTLQVAIAAGFDIGKVTSPGHDITVTRPEDGRAVVRLNGDAVPADRDFVLRWAPAEAGAGPQAGFFWEKTAGDTYGLLMLMPPVSGGAGLALPRPARDVTFVLDTSGSMKGVSLTQAKEALAMALDRLTLADRFRVIRFASGYSDLTPLPVAADAAAVARAQVYVRGLQAEGGTEIVNAVTAALAGVHGPAEDTGQGTRSRLKQIVLITDGAIGDEDRLLSLINGRIGDARLFTVGIGSAPNGFLMTRAARAGRGSYTFIQAAGEIKERMAELFLKLERPALTDVALTWPQGGVHSVEVWPRPLPDLYAGEPLVALMKLNGAGPEMKVSGRLGGRFWEQSVTITGGAPAPGVASLWGREKIRQLMANMRTASLHLEPKDADAARVEIRREIVDTALALGLVSKFTSLVAVDLETAPSRPAGTPLAAAQVPVNLPAGWDRGGLEGTPAAPVPSLQKTMAPATPMPAGQAATLAFDRTDPAMRAHLAAAGSGTPLAATP